MPNDIAVADTFVSPIDPVKQNRCFNAVAVSQRFFGFVVLSWVAINAASLSRGTAWAGDRPRDDVNRDGANEVIALDEAFNDGVTEARANTKDSSIPIESTPTESTPTESVESESAESLLLQEANSNDQPNDQSEEDLAEESLDGDVPTEDAPPEDAPTEEVPAVDSASGVLQAAATLAAQAETMAQRAASAADWDAVMAQWLQAVTLLQSIPPESPSRIVAQRQMRGYLQRVLEVQQRTEQASPTSGLPSLGSEVFDAQLSGYLSYMATMGTPDVLIVGSSRALQGIDPQAMQQSLARRGYPSLKVFNFSVNGATAQVVNFVVSELLPLPLPPVIVWGDGSRAFNDGRRDRTWESLRASPGYQAIHSGALPDSLFLETLSATSASFRPATVVTDRSPLPKAQENLDALGFLAVGDRFTPQAYYQRFPRVSGQYDGAYSPFRLYGTQTDALASLASFTQAQKTRLIFVNLPLSSSYLDDYRLYYEGQFQQFLQAQSRELGFDVVDLLTQWDEQPSLFADPSHINQEGAAAIAAQLAQNAKVLAALNSQEITPEAD